MESDIPGEDSTTDFTSMSRGELQALAKARGLKANAKTAELVKMLEEAVVMCPQAPEMAEAQGRKSLPNKRISIAPKIQQAEDAADVNLEGHEDSAETQSTHARWKSAARKSSSAGAGASPDGSNTTKEARSEQAGRKSVSYKLQSIASSLRDPPVVDATEATVIEDPSNRTASHLSSVAPLEPVPVPVHDGSDVMVQAAQASTRRSSVAAAATPSFKLETTAMEEEVQVSTATKRRSSGGPRRSCAAALADMEEMQVPTNRTSSSGKRRSSVTTRPVAMSEAALKELQDVAPAPSVVTSLTSRRSSVAPVGGCLPVTVTPSPSAGANKSARRSSVGRTVSSLESLPSISTLSPRSSRRTTGARSSATRASLGTQHSSLDLALPSAEKVLP